MTSPGTSTGTEPPAVAAAAEHPVTAYARAVVEGRQVAGRYQVAACRRHLEDLEKGPARGLTFSAAAADRALDFFPRHLRHYEGEWRGQPLVLSPWQAFIVGSLFGWKRADGMRRFRQAFIETGKKSGKSTLAAGIANLVTFFDSPREGGAQGYCAATKKEQAKAVWKAAREMVLASPMLKQTIRCWGGTRENSVGSLSREDIGSYLKPLTRDHRGTEGINPHFVSADEVHAWDGRAFWDVLKMSRSSRRQPLMLAITNTGTDTNSLWHDLRERAIRVAEGTEQDDALFAFVCCIDKGDDWRDERVWMKCNPGLGISVKVEEVRSLRDDALTTPSAVNPFRRYYCGEIVAGDEAAFDMAKWKACGEPFDPEVLRGRTCFGGLDLASSIDLTALVLVFPPAPGDPRRLLHVLTWVFGPADTLEERCRAERLDYYRWRDDGHFIATPGVTTDYSFVRKVLEDQAKRFRIVELAYDKTGADETRVELEKSGVTMVDVRQGHLSLSGPCKFLEGEYLAGRLRHGGHPVLSWMASNVVWRRDANNNFIPDKGKAQKKRKHIDGISALVTALNRVIASPKGKASAYGPGGARESGLLVIGQKPAAPAGGVA